FRGRSRRAVGPGRRGGMEAARIVRGGIERIAEPAADFVAGDDRGQHSAPGWRCRGNPRSEPWRAPTLPAGYPRISARRHSLRAFRFHGPSFFLVLWHRVGGLILSFKPACASRLTKAGQQLCAISFPSITGIACNIGEWDP